MTVEGSGRPVSWKRRSYPVLADASGSVRFYVFVAVVGFED